MPRLLGVGKNYAWVTKFPHAYCAETPVSLLHSSIITRWEVSKSVAAPLISLRSYASSYNSIIYAAHEIPLREKIEF